MNDQCPPPLLARPLRGTSTGTGLVQVSRLTMYSVLSSFCIAIGRFASSNSTIRRLTPQEGVTHGVPRFECPGCFHDFNESHAFTGASLRPMEPLHTWDIFTERECASKKHVPRETSPCALDERLGAPGKFAISGIGMLTSTGKASSAASKSDGGSNSPKTHVPPGPGASGTTLSNFKAC